MKLKTIASIFNRNKRLIIYTAPNGEQWISNGFAAYSLRGMPYLTPEVALRIFDVPADKHNKWICEESELPAAIGFEDNVPGEADIEPLKINIEYFGVNYWLFPDGRRIYSFNEDYIKPLLDEPDYLTYHKRETSGGGFVLACKVGFELKAIICPMTLHDKEDYTAEIERIAQLYKNTAAEMERDRVVNAAYEIYGAAKAEPPPEVDPDTGEVLDGQTVMSGGADDEA
jgi:hypothetical protein